MTRRTVTNGLASAAAMIAFLMVVSCDAVQDALDLAFLEPGVELSPADTVGEVPLPDEGDVGSVDDVLRVACCFAADSEIQRQIGVLEDAQTGGLGLEEALARAAARRWCKRVARQRGLGSRF